MNFIHRDLIIGSQNKQVPQRFYSRVNENINKLNQTNRLKLRSPYAHRTHSQQYTSSTFQPSLTRLRPYTGDSVSILLLRTAVSFAYTPVMKEEIVGVWDKNNFMSLLHLCPYIGTKSHAIWVSERIVPSMPKNKKTVIQEPLRQYSVIRIYEQHCNLITCGPFCFNRRTQCWDNHKGTLSQQIWQTHVNNSLKGISNLSSDRFCYRCELRLLQNRPCAQDSQPLENVVILKNLLRVHSMYITSFQWMLIIISNYVSLGNQTLSAMK